MIGPILLLLFMLGWLAAVAAPQSAIGRRFRRLFVEAPARLLETSPKTVLLWLLVVAALAVISVVAPEVMALMGVSDLTAYFDLALISLALSAVRLARSGAVAALTIARQGLTALARVRPAASRRGLRTRRVRKVRPPAPSEDSVPAGAWAIA